VPQPSQLQLQNAGDEIVFLSVKKIGCKNSMTTSITSKVTNIKIVGFFWAGLTLSAISAITDAIESKGSITYAVLLSFSSMACLWIINRMYKNYKYSLATEGKRADAERLWAEQEKAKLQKFRSEAANYIEGESFSGRYLGGSGHTFEKNAQITIGQCKDGIYLGCLSSLEHKIISIDTITLLEISGEGTVTTNAGVVGGGFGVEGFIKGAIVAEVLNAATTKSRTNTFLRIMTTDSELYFHTSEREPAHLQILFSKVFVHINSAKTKKANRTGISDELLKLHSLFKDGALTQDEFDVAKRNLLER